METGLEDEATIENKKAYQSRMRETAENKRDTQTYRCANSAKAITQTTYHYTDAKGNKERTITTNFWIHASCKQEDTAPSGRIDNSLT